MMEHIYTDGPQPDDRERATEHFPLRLYIENVNKGYIGGFTIPLPATAEELRPFIEGAEITGWQDMKIWEAESDIEGLGDKVTEAFQASLSPDTLNELNYLAARIDSLQQEEFAIFSAAMQAGWHSGTVAELINLTYNCDAFYLQPANNAAQYGEFLVDMFKDETSNAFIKLEQSDNTEQRDLAQHVLRLEAAVNYEAYGRNYADEENGVFTDHGYITGVGQYDVVYRGPEDIFDEYRVFDGNAQLEAQRVKLEGVAIAPLVLQMHAMTGDLSTARNSLTLLDGGSQDFFLRLEGNNLALHSAKDVYYKYSPAYDLWTDANTSGVRAFSLSFHGPDKGMGNIYELDPDILRANILRYGTMRGITDDEMRERIQHSASAIGWDSLDSVGRAHETRAIRAHADREIAALAAHLADQRKSCNETCRSVSPLLFLTSLNRDFMGRSECARADMLRIPNETAKELLATGVQVFHLTPQGPRQMSVLEAVNGKVWNYSDSAVAILPAELGALEKWVERTSSELLRAQERGEKQKSRGPEL